MPSQPQLPRMPRVLLVRHGETEWSLSGQHVTYALISRRAANCKAAKRAQDPDELLPCVSNLPQTGRSDIPLTENGEAVLAGLGKEIVGDGSEHARAF